MAEPIQSPAKGEARSVIRFLNAKVNVERKFTNKLLLFMVTLWIGKMWRKIKVQKIVRKLGAQNVNGRSQNETDGFRAKFLMRYAQERDEFLDSIVTGDETWGFHHTPESKQQSLQCKKSWRGSKGWRQTSMTWGYRSWFQDLMNVWTMPVTMLKNKVMYKKFIHSVTFVN